MTESQDEGYAALAATQDDEDRQYEAALRARGRRRTGEEPTEES
jgi:hypothetical protein